jgi:hypothetical protein
MLQDRRKAPRQATNRKAHVRDAVSTQIRDCLITDISETGVRLLVERAQVEDRFTLWFSKQVTDRRECRVAWRLGCEIGAEFIDGDEAEFAQRMAALLPANWKSSGKD